jgi:hypothetical protein
MTGIRALCLGLLACFGFAAFALPAQANPAPPPEIFKKRDAEKAAPIDPETGQPMPVRPEPDRRRTGPFRSCGSGAGAGLAGIGIAWGLMWVGHRYAARVARRK